MLEHIDIPIQLVSSLEVNTITYLNMDKLTASGVYKHQRYLQKLQ